MGEADSPLLEVRGLVKDYPGVRALDGVDLNVTRGQVHCLIGQNGAGKSTLIKSVSGLVEPTAASPVQGRAAPGRRTPDSIARIATIYQELDLVPHLSVALNVFLGHERRRGPLLNRAAMHRETAALLARLGDEGIAPTAAVTTLRPAQQQVVSMARALSHSVKLLILDEPSAVLDDVEVEALFNVVRRLTAEGVGIIWISHRLGEVAQLGDRVTVLREGRTVATELPPDTPVDTLIGHMVGGRMETLFPDRKPHREATVLQVRGLTRAPDVHDASFDLREGESRPGRVVGSGATSARLIYGWTRPSRRGGVGGAASPRPPDLAIRAVLGARPRSASPRGCCWTGAWPGTPRLPTWPGSGAARSPTAPASDRKPPATCGRSRPGRTRPNARRGSSPAATSRRRSWPAGCCAPAVSCCWTNRPGGSTSAPAQRSIG